MYGHSRGSCVNPLFLWDLEVVPLLFPLNRGNCSYPRSPFQYLLVSELRVLVVSRFSKSFLFITKILFKWQIPPSLRSARCCWRIQKHLSRTTTRKSLRLFLPMGYLPEGQEVCAGTPQRPCQPHVGAPCTVHAHLDDLRIVLLAASVAQHRTIATALLLNYDTLSKTGPWVTLFVRSALPNAMPGDTPVKRKPLAPRRSVSSRSPALAYLPRARYCSLRPGSPCRLRFCLSTSILWSWMLARLDALSCGRLAG